MPRRHEMLETNECFTACGFIVTRSISHISFIFQQILFKSIKQINYHYYFYCNWSAALHSQWDAIPFRAVCTGHEGSESCHKKPGKKITLLGSSWWLGGKMLLVAPCLCGQCRTSPGQLCAGEIWRRNTEELYPDPAVKAEMRCVQCRVPAKRGTVPREGKSMCGSLTCQLLGTEKWGFGRAVSLLIKKSPKIRTYSFQEVL